MSYDPDTRPAADDIPARRAPAWLRWLAVGFAAAVLVLGIVSLISSLTHRAGEERANAAAQLKKTIASEEAELRDLQSDYDETLAVLEEKKSEYDEVRKKLESGVIDTTSEGQISLSQLRADAEAAQKDYSAVLAAYDAAVDAVQQNTDSSNEAKAQLEKLQPLQGHAAAYEQFLSGAADSLPGVSPEDGEEAPDAQTWYAAIVLPAAAQAGVSLPDTVEAFPAAVQALAAEPSARVKAYDDALAAVKDAEAKLAAANAAQEAAAKAYADGKASQKTSEDWLSDSEQEIDRLEKRIQDLEKSIEDVRSALENHRAELKKLDT